MSGGEGAHQDTGNCGGQLQDTGNREEGCTSIILVLVLINVYHLLKSIDIVRRVNNRPLSSKSAPGMDYNKAIITLSVQQRDIL